MTRLNLAGFALAVGFGFFLAKVMGHPHDGVGWLIATAFAAVATWTNLIYMRRKWSNTTRCDRTLCVREATHLVRADKESGVYCNMHTARIVRRDNTAMMTKI